MKAKANREIYTMYKNDMSEMIAQWFSRLENTNFDLNSKKRLSYPVKVNKN